jgi:hypothetical protein
MAHRNRIAADDWLDEMLMPGSFAQIEATYYAATNAEIVDCFVARYCSSCAPPRK